MIMVDEDELHVLWVKGQCSGSIAFIGDDVLCYPCSNYIKAICLNGSEESFTIGLRNIGCMTANKEFGVVAVSETKLNPVVYVLKYPELQTVIKSLHNGAKRKYLGMEFSGAELLITVTGDPDFIVIIWNWITGCKMFTLEQHLHVQNPQNFQLSVNPSINSEFCIHNSAGLTFFTIDDARLQLRVNSKSLYMPWVHSQNYDTAVVSDEINNLTLFDKMNHTNWGTHSDIIHKLPLAMMTDLPISEMVKFHDYVLNKKRMVPSCHCWLPLNNLVIGCTNGVLFNLQTDTMKLTFMNNIRKSPKTVPTKLNIITAVAINTIALFAGKHDGTVWMLTELNDKWSIKAIIELGLLIKGFFFAPDYKTLTVVSTSGSIFLYDTKEGNSYTTSRLVHCKCKSAIVGICTPYKLHCLTVRRLGLLELWNINNGTFISKLNINCHVECVDGSPLCSLAFIGTTTGHVYIIDATNIKLLRVLKVFKLFDQSVKKIKCENFGRYVVSLSSSGIVFITSAIPSSNFAPLGMINTKGDVVDAYIFTENIQSPSVITLLLNLPVNLTQQNEERNVLMEVVLPDDFYRNYRVYWQNGSGLLNDKIQILESVIYAPISSIILHENYGAIVYESKSHVIKNIKTAFYKEKPELHISTLHETDFCSLFVNNTHSLLASTGSDGKVIVYELANLSRVYMSNSVHPFTKDKIIYACFIESKSILITGGQDGVVACHGWNPQSFHEKDHAQRWNSHCWSWKAVQNQYISKMSEQGVETSVSWEAWSADVNSKTTIEELTKINSELGKKSENMYTKISHVTERNYLLPPEYQLKTEDLFLDADILLKMTNDRTASLLSFIYELFMKLQRMKDEALKIKMNNIDRMLSLRQNVKSLCQGHEIYNYSYCQKSQLHKDRMKTIFQKKQCQIGDKLPKNMSNVEYEKIGDTTNMNELLLYNYFDLKSREQIIDQLHILQDMVYQIKVDFNKKFHNHIIFKESQKEILVLKIARMKFLNSVLKIDEAVWEPDWDCDETPEDHFEMPSLEMRPNNNSKLKMKGLSCKSKRDKDKNIGKSRIIEMAKLINPKDETEDEILSEIAKPDFMESVLPIHWTKSECQIVEAFDTKLKKHETVQKKYITKLKWERVQLKAEIEDIINSFDNTHQEFLTEKLNTDFYINFNELTMAILLFLVSVDDQLIEYETYLKNELLLTQSQNKWIPSMIDDAQKNVHTLEKIYEEQLEHDKEIDEAMKIFCRQKQNNKALDFVINTIKTIANSETNNPFSKVKPNPINRAILQASQASVFTDGRSKKVSKNAGKRACSLLFHKFSSEENLKQSRKNLDHGKMVLQKYEKRKDERRNNVGKLVEDMAQLHQKKVLALNDIPYVFSMEYKNLEMENQFNISASYFMVHEKHIDELGLGAAEMKHNLLNAIRYGARVRHDLKINFINYRRLNFKIEEYQKKLTMIDTIPLTKDLKIILASDEINPYAKSHTLISSAAHEETELLRQIAAANLEQKRVKKEIVAEIMSYTDLEKRITILKRDLSQLKYLIDKG